MKKEIVKKDYVPPEILEIRFIETEQGVANSSSQIIPGGSGNQPAVTDWVEKR